MSTPDYISLETKNLSQADIYKLMIGAIIPRPIALVSTISLEGNLNLAPFSFFNAISSSPACLIISISYRSNGEKKDTLINIESTKEFVVNSADECFIDKIVCTASEYPYGVSEMSIVGLSPSAACLVKPPAVKESSFRMECKLHEIVKIGEQPTGTHLVIGEILMFHVNKLIYQDGKINYDHYHPAARLGGNSYAKLADLYQIPIPKI